jgi:hypothetical protein
LPALIEYKAYLIVQLLDATNGAVAAGNAKFLVNGEKASPLYKDSGHYIFLTKMPEEFTLEVQVFTFEPWIRVISNPPGPGPNMEAAELIPDFRFHPSCRTLEGQEKGLTGLDAVKYDDGACLVKEFDTRKRLMTIINPHKLALDRPRYAVVNPDKRTYEPFSIVKRVSDTVLKIDKPLQNEEIAQFPLTPVVSGAVYQDGRYLLRVRDTYSDKRYITRMEKGGKEDFRFVEIP